VLAWTAAKMITGEPALADFFAARPGASVAVYAAVIGGVMGAALLASRRRAAAAA
jgi:hypothetical protein